MKQHYRWVPSIYFMQGMPFAIVMILTSIFYKGFNIDNARIAFYTSLLILPWSLKPLISPLLENIFSKRKLTIFTECLIGCCLLAIPLFLFSKTFFGPSLIAFFILAFCGSIHDTCSDAIYLINLTEKEQASFVGIRIVSYQAARFFVASGLVILSGILNIYVSIVTSWTLVFLLASSLSFNASFFHYFVLPKHKKDCVKEVPLYQSIRFVIKEAMKTKHIFIVALFLFAYNMPEAQLMKVVPLFLLDSHTHGGLNLSNITVGTIFGGFGICALIAGAFLSGKIVAKLGVKKTLLPLCIFTVLSNAFYLLLFLPVFQHLWSLLVVVIIAQFGFGVSNGAYMTYLLKQVNSRPYQMSLYAYGTALMAFGMFASGSLSGIIQSEIGYFNFFLWIILFGAIITLLTFFTVKRIPSYANR